MIASKDSFEPSSRDQLPNSTRIYIEGNLHEDIRVPMREIALNPTKSLNGDTKENAPVRVYDTSGPWGDPAFEGKVDAGLPPLRDKWIHSRGDVEEYDGLDARFPMLGFRCSIFAARSRMLDFRR